MGAGKCTCRPGAKFFWYSPKRNTAARSPSSTITTPVASHAIAATTPSTKKPPGPRLGPPRPPPPPPRPRREKRSCILRIWSSMSEPPPWPPPPGRPQGEPPSPLPPEPPLPHGPPLALGGSSPFPLLSFQGIAPPFGHTRCLAFYLPRAYLRSKGPFIKDIAHVLGQERA